MPKFNIPALNKKTIIIAAIAILVIAAVVGFFMLKAMPEKYLAAQVEKLNRDLGGEIKYDAVEFDKAFFPTVASLKGFSFSRDSFAGQITISSKEAKIMVADQQVNEIVFSGLVLKQEATNNFGPVQLGKIVTDQEVIVEVVSGKTQQIAVQLPQKFVAEQPYKRSTFEYVGDTPVLKAAFSGDGDLEMLDYRDNGTSLRAEYTGDVATGVVEESEVDPIVISYNKSEEQKGTNIDVVVKMSLPTKQDQNLQDIVDLTDKQKQDAEDLLYFNNVSIDVDVSFFAENTTNALSFINVKKLDLIGSSYSASLQYRGGTVVAGASLPNGSGKFTFKNYEQFLSKLGNVYAIMKNLSELGADQHQSQVATDEIAQYITGMDVEEFLEILEKSKKFLSAINASEEEENFFMAFAFVPPYSLIINDKKVEELLLIWDEISSEKSGNKSEPQYQVPAPVTEQ